MSERNIIRKEIRFIGRVQGVGFRYQARHAANSCGVTGWVHNEWDGSVLMEAQGTEAEIREMVKMLRNGRFIEINQMQYRELPVDEYERSFRVR